MNSGNDVGSEPGNDLPAPYLATEVSIEVDGELTPAHRVAQVADGVMHVITAWNPGNARPDQHTNDVANRALYRDLVAKGLTPIRAIGADPHSSHYEESWAVTGLTDNEARILGAKYGQVAVFRLEWSTQTVLGCVDDWSLTRPL